jgi:large subunit ribosomal protein L19
MVKVLGNLDVDLKAFYKKDDLPTLNIGDSVKVTIYLELPKKAEEGEKKEKERIQVYEGVIISKHRNSTQIDSTITVRKMFQGGGIEKVFILNSPWVKTMEVLRRAKVKRAKLYYLRERTGKSARLKTKFN